MKTIFTILVTLILFSYNFSFGQRIEKDITDEFTKTRKVYSSWEKLIFNFKGNAFYRFKVLDSVAIFDFKYITECTVRENAEFYFKCDNDSILYVKSMGYYIPGRGDGAVGYMSSNTIGVNALYDISREIIEYLAQHNVVKVRLICSGGYMEIELNNRNSEILKKTCALILPYVKY